MFLITEDFADDLELTEEEQIRILEQYELETKLRNIEKEHIKKEQPGDDKSPVKSKMKLSINNKRNSTDIKQEEKSAVKSKGSSTSTGNCSSSSNTSTDDDWEKINDVDK